MTDDDEEVEVEFLPENEVLLHDGQCWVRDPDYLETGSGVEGVIALRYCSEYGLLYLDGLTRQWVSVTETKRQGATLTRIQ